MAQKSLHLPAYLYRRNLTFYFRKRIPVSFVRYFAKPELRFSLGVSSLALAKEKGAALLQQTEQLLRTLTLMKSRKDQFDKHSDSTMAQLTEQKINHLITTFYRDTREQTEQSWQNRKFEDSEHLRSEIDTHRAVFSSLKEDLVCNRIDDFANVVNDFLKSEGMRNVNSDSPAFHKLTRRLYATSIKAVDDTLKEVSNPFSNITDYLEPTKLNENSPIEPADEPPAADIYSLATAINDYTDESLRLGNWTVKTKGEQIACLELLEEILGTRTDVHEIERKQLVEVKDTLIRFPTNRKKDRRFRDKPIAEILQMEFKPMTARTVNNYLVRYVCFFNWLKRRGSIRDNPAEGLIIKSKRNPRDERAAFSKEELFRMIELLRLEKKRPERFWITLLGLYTGARLNELCQLDTADVCKTEDGIWFISINTTGDLKKCVKTKYAVRDVPINDKLIGLGFLDYVNQRKNSDSAKLWDLSYDEKEGYKRPISRWFNVRFKGKFIESNSIVKKDFHSFRHTMINYLMSKNVEESVISQIVGHSPKSITFGRYGKGFPIQVLKKAILKLDFYGIDG